MLLLLAWTAPSSSSLFYCRRLKGVCKQRRDYIRCRDENKATTSIAEETTDVAEEGVDDQEQTTQPYFSTTVEDTAPDKPQVSLNSA